ncbi:uncharacterized protein LOC126903982 [Daktulosphaira vitifoliae]|uniref:uncharacterized protein LOC126903982 n=1 Tax=Daktulosphaira vitifoliae TaxID=58002 RepID=UPI0021AB0A9C|nr:uncharacterized protein LOC126903982 [Daktulosphaira vitifoliae]
MLYIFFKKSKIIIFLTCLMDFTPISNKSFVKTSGTTEEFSSLPNSYDGDNNIRRLTLFDILDVSHIKELKKYFYYDENSEKCHPLNKNDFVEAICSITNHESLVEEAKDFFEKACVEDPKLKIDVLTWKQILDEIRYIAAISEHFKEKNLFEQNVSMYLMSHCKHEVIIKVLSIETEESFCYTIISKFGKIGIYDGRLNLLREYALQLFQFSDDSVKTSRRRRNTWINDAIYMSDAQFIALITSDGAIHFIDTVCLIHVPTFIITGLKNTPTSLEYCAGNTSLLFVGDDKGYITYLEFQQPLRSLFKRDPTNKVDVYLFKELYLQEKWVKVYTSIEPLHSDYVKQITYCHAKKSILSCCYSSKRSLVIKHLYDQWSPYIFNIKNGVRCFNYSEQLKLLVTGCSTTIYVWNPVVTNKHMAILNGHNKKVVDVRILEHLNAIISISKDEVFKIWDLNSYLCLQTIEFDFPVNSVLKKVVEFSLRSFYPGPITKQPPEEQQASLKSIDVSNITSLPTSSYLPKENWVSNVLLVACSNFIAILQLSLKETFQKRSPLSPPLEEKKPALPSEWSFSDIEFINIEDVNEVHLSSPKINNDSMKKNLIKGRPKLNHVAFCIDPFRKYNNPTMRNYVEEMVKNGTPHLAMHLCSVNKLELSKDLILSETVKAKFPYLNKINDLLNDGVIYDSKLSLPIKKMIPNQVITLEKLMNEINSLEFEDNDNFEEKIQHFI